MVDGPVDAWRVHDTGLVAVPGRFRRLGGLVRHLQGHGEQWPDTVTLSVTDDELVVTAAGRPVGAWALAEVSVIPMGDGPPVTFVLELPAATHLLAAPAAAATTALLARIG